MSGIRIAAAVLIGVLAAGCQQSSRTGPPNLRYGDETCAHCRMIISDERFAAALIDRDGEILKFDDVGCMTRQEQERASEVSARWVRDFSRPGWLDARNAIFVYSPAIVSPMGYGLAAVATPEQASVLVAGPGARRLQFDELADWVGKQKAAGTGAGPDRPIVSESSAR